MRNSRKWILALTLLAALLRFRGLFNNTFYPDEALYATWARWIATWRDPLLLDQLVDKPPLAYYFQALFYPLFGPVEFAARIPNFAASLLLIPLTAALVWQIYHDEMTMILAAAFTSFSPMLISYSATAFTDPLMILLVVVALVIIARSDHRAPSEGFSSERIRKPLLAGLAFGLALATKYQAILFLPLVIGLGMAVKWASKQWLRALAGASLPVAAVILWDIIRNGGFHLAEFQFRSFGGLRFAWSWELWPRLEQLSLYWGKMFDAPVLHFALLLAIPLFLALLIARHGRENTLDQLMVIFLIGYFGLHWLVAIPVWDRYVLPAVPLASIVIARFVTRVIWFVLDGLPFEKLQLKSTSVLPPLLVAGILLLQALGVMKAYNGTLGIGGSPGGNGSISQVAEYLDEKPYGTVLYDHWYSWLLRYYMFDSKVYISWFADSDTLLQDVKAFCDRGQRFLVLPPGVAAVPVLQALSERGVVLKQLDVTSVNKEQSAPLLYEIGCM